MAPLAPALQPLRDRPAAAALFLDYDGTLAPIVDDPAAAVPFPGVRELLAELGERLGRVAVVSGRPVAYLAAMLGSPSGVHLAGLYGMEELAGGEVPPPPPEVEQWRAVVAGVAERLRRALPPETAVEDKGLTVTVHWRRAPDVARVSEAVARATADAAGLVAHPGRMSVEFRPPVGADKGTVVRRLGTGYPVVACFGDDLGDLPAFEALDELRTAGASVVKVAVVDAGTPPAVAAAADLVVRGPAEAVAALWAIVSG